MTQFETDQEEVDEEESPKGLRKQLAEQARQIAALQQERDATARDLAFTKVGLPNTPMASFFQENYQGEHSEEAIRARASELGLIGGASQETTDAIEAIDQMSEQATGSQPPLPADKEEEMYAAMRQIPASASNYSQQVETILQQYGRPTMRDDT